MALTKHKKLARGISQLLNSLEEHFQKTAKSLHCLQLFFYETHLMIGRPLMDQRALAAIWSLPNGIDLKDIPFFVSNRPAQFLDDDSAKEVILAIEELKAKYGEPTFVVIDTLNRNFGPGDESDNADMTKFIMAIDTSIRLRYECTVLTLHHPPLNDSKRGRGASALHVALDWAYSLKKDGKVITLSNTKVKDHEPPPDICFKPETISLSGWMDEEDGQTMTSCVLKTVDGPATHKNDTKPTLTSFQKVAYDSLLNLCGADFSDDSEGVGKPRDVQHQRILEVQARQRFYASGGNREAYLAFLPFDSFPEGFYGYIKKSEFIKAVTNKTNNPAEN